MTNRGFNKQKRGNSIVTPSGDTPILVYQATWDRLKAERGQIVHWDRLGAPCHLMDSIPTSLNAAIDANEPTRIARIRARAAQIKRHTL